MEFTHYLNSKKIDSDAFKKSDPVQWHAWKKDFDQMHPTSFTAQKLFLINPLRHLFPFAGSVDAAIESSQQKKPVIKPKPQVPKNVETAKPNVRIKPKLPSKPKMEEKPAGAKPRPVIRKPKKD